MNEMQANSLANIVGGEAWQSGGGVWLVTLDREDDHIIVFSGDAVCEYESDDAFNDGRASNTIVMTHDDQWWIIKDEESIIYRDPALQIGWRSRADAELEADSIASHTGLHTWVEEAPPSS